ncbi:RES family NAD+ phosphorylase [Arenibacter algicola]|jgi:RES domain-containing protein|uniref:RES domain protein n=1 Tax=Arenibacter algicola TaxID=616991 RepID=A0A221V0P1_9FLAO|nr:RES family NAD+ phosphorylase [Arenibacter algicola]ASO07175.1 RES domain protein [Arenibacter algicola]|tara:strand:- start:121 stop:588 length:468 start_codon:yes stop_codon:yes gene_type:complete
MVVYRVANAKYKDSTLSGIGAEKVGGRWNSVGTRAVYCSENISLALLEYYVHSDDISTLPKKILIAKIQFPDDLIIEELEEIPDTWKDYPYTSETAQVFTEFVKDRNKFALKVPSTIVGLESNIILNPLYKEFGNVEVVEFLELPIDQRLKKGIR